MTVLLLVPFHAIGMVFKRTSPTKGSEMELVSFGPNLPPSPMSRRNALGWSAFLFLPTYLENKQEGDPILLHWNTEKGMLTCVPLPLGSEKREVHLRV